MSQAGPVFSPALHLGLFAVGAGIVGRQVAAHLGEFDQFNPGWSGFVGQGTQGPSPTFRLWQMMHADDMSSTWGVVGGEKVWGLSRGTRVPLECGQLQLQLHLRLHLQLHAMAIT